MTLKEFSDKYCVDYNTVFKASCNVKPVSTLQRDKDFPEEELYKQVNKELNNRIFIHLEYVGKYNSIKDNMRRIKLYGKRQAENSGRS